MEPPSGPITRLSPNLLFLAYPTPLRNITEVVGSGLRHSDPLYVRVVEVKYHCRQLHTAQFQLVNLKHGLSIDTASCFQQGDPLYVILLSKG